MKGLWVYVQCKVYISLRDYGAYRICTVVFGTFCQYSYYKKSTVGADKKKTTFYQSYLFLRSEERVYLLFLNFLYSFQPNTIPSKTPAPVFNSPENRLDGKLVVNEDGDVPNN